MADFEGIDKRPVKMYPTLGCCGLDCGLCPRYYTIGSSKCPGCCGPEFFSKHPSCSFITCCVKKRNLEVCAQCDEFPCSKFEGEVWTYDSFLTHKKAMPNLSSIKEHGIAEFMEQQKKRIQLLNTMIRSFDDGRSRSFYCIAATLLSIASLEASLNKAEQEIRACSIKPDDTKGRARILRGFLESLADEEGIKLSLKKKGKLNGRK